MAPLYLLDSTHKLATTPPFFWSTVICTYVSCSSPIAAAASKRLFQIFFGIISAYLAYQNGVSVEEDKVYNHYIYKEVKIYPISLRDGSEPGLKSSFLDFGLLKDRCVIPPSGQSWKNGTLEVLFPTRLVWFGLVKCCQKGLGHSAQTFILCFSSLAVSLSIPGHGCSQISTFPVTSCIGNYVMCGIWCQWNYDLEHQA